MLWTSAVRVHRGLIALVVAVIFTIALPLAGAQTAPVRTAELIGATGRILTLRGLIGAISAVTVMVTHEVLGDALAILAHELAVIAGAIVQAAGCDALIGAISTVFVTITEPAIRDTHMGAWAGEGVGAARLAFTVSRLVRAVPAVITTITQPLLGDAAMVLALKLGL